MKKSVLTQFQLFNIRTDITQKTNIAGAHPEKTDQLKKLMIEQYKQLISTCPTWGELPN